MGTATAAPVEETAAPVVSLTLDELEALLRQVREEAIQAMVTPTAPEEDAEPAKSKRVLDISNADRVLRLKTSKDLIKFTGGKPLGWAYSKLRRRIAVFGTMSEEASKRIFSGSLTRIQAVAASHALEHGRPVVIDGIRIEPKA